MALVSGFALRADLVSLPPLVLIAGSTDREAALVAGNEGLPVAPNLYLIAANMAGLAAQLLQRLGLENTKTIS